MFIYRATSQSQVITVSTGRAKSDEARRMGGLLHTSREGRSDLNTVKTVTMSFHRTPTSYNILKQERLKIRSRYYVPLEGQRPP